MRKTRRAKKEKAAGKARPARKARRRRAAEGKRHRPLASFLTSFLVTLAVFASLAAVVVTDQNTRRIGWSSDETALAFSSQSQKLSVRVMGNSFVFDIGAGRRILSEQRRVCGVFDRISPAPGRFCAEAAELGSFGALRLYQKYLSLTA